MKEIKFYYARFKESGFWNFWITFWKEWNKGIIPREVREVQITIQAKSEKQARKIFRKFINAIRKNKIKTNRAK